MNTLSPACQKFVLHWGEMGARWGINRTMAQIHALLYLSDRPLTAEELALTLGVARSNVSTSLREPQNWKIVRLVHLVGDNRDHFESLHDVWEMFRIILDERISRELGADSWSCSSVVSPTSPRMASPDPTSAAGDQAALADFFERLCPSGMPRSAKWPQSVLIRFLRLGNKLLKLIPGFAMNK